MPNYHITRDDVKKYKGNPNGAIMPDYVGQLCIDELKEVFYISTSLNINGWISSVFDGEIDISNKQDTSDSNLNTTDKTIIGAINELKAKVDETSQEIDQIDISNKQDITDNSLNTTDKTISGAINELKTKVDETFQEVDSGKTLIATAIDDPSVTKFSTFIAMSKAIVSLKNSKNPNLDAADILYEMMLEDGYTSAAGNMDTDQLIELLDASKIELEIKEVICGTDFTFVLKNDGTVWATGRNNRGQLGLGDQYDMYSFTKVNIDNVKQISCGGTHTFMLKNDGTVWSCGFNYSGQLGLGDSTQRESFTKVNIDNVKQIACGYNHTVLVKNDGTVWACGDNLNGQLGLGSYIEKKTFTQVSIDNVKQVSCGFEHTVLVKNDGTVWACGDGENGQLGLGSYIEKRATFTQVSIDNVKQASCGSGHTVLVKNDGTIWACGMNNSGELGLGHQTNMTTFTQINNVDNVKQVSCGFYHTVLVKNDGTVWACGDNSLGQLGVGWGSSYTTFTQVDIDNIRQVSCGAYYVFLLKNDCTLWANGDNEEGQLGLGHTEYNDFEQPTDSPADGLASSELNRLRLYVYLLDNEIPVTEIMDIDTMLELLVYSYGVPGGGSTSGGIDIVCAASLPETVVENQIVLITSNVPLVKEMRDYSNSIPTSNEEIIIGISTTKDNGAMIPYSTTINNTVLTLYLTIAKGKFNDKLETYNGYIGRDGEWLQFSSERYIAYSNGYDAIGFTSTNNWTCSSNMYFSNTSTSIDLKMKAYTGGWNDEYAYFRNSIDLTNVRQVRIVGSFNNNGATSSGVGFVTSNNFTIHPTWAKKVNLTSSVKEVITDVSSLKGSYYFGTVNRCDGTARNAMKITEFELIY